MSFLLFLGSLPHWDHSWLIPESSVIPLRSHLSAMAFSSSFMVGYRPPSVKSLPAFHFQATTKGSKGGTDLYNRGV